MTQVVYFSSTSENTHRFVQKLGLPAQRIPLRRSTPALRVEAPYVLIVPTYGGGHQGGAVPKQVIGFLNDEHNRSLLSGVVAAGNTNFGSAYCLAGRIIAAKCGVPQLHTFELMGTGEDVAAVREGLSHTWKPLLSPTSGPNRSPSPTTTPSMPC
ncbi:class Ib ribonucleoside-diphosphate reductase assembly flavoprotein NrdI [Aestuariimicrobium sp. p3-SID1156]|uniref:class Ib ribonucleoside-diphosphate reductase assembly flavoprotein NrdI n=1 Tax=Aestuariimicrobium sp. p3-SID1156 TaxID=2916038 RepID=UPI00223A9251|nr:class Ib ribonucleoside-diphosphate reductase assembly flavoprotein NrdI [Aestuariimicrobium sp. p3-SID1156]MCT1459812.1 class Ib ribonucleoside-diphosphate reductase assembly flavoprotein NrdI [Aestuariimicrobium sp. p3-SID1156]